jgi:hypothetical protein
MRSETWQQFMGQNPASSMRLKSFKHKGIAVFAERGAVSWCPLSKASVRFWTAPIRLLPAKDGV